ncbi:MAG TPA: FeoB-associated Cys-rich membrane protein [Anaerovoracaceae bacterium]|nr:FeoB-associated Cys-rich membrane protein [Anaerovoracaceae bacterium]
MNITDIIIGGLVLLALILAVRKIIKQKKSGGCCYGCSGCSSEETCNAYDAFETEAKETLQKNNKDQNKLTTE